MHMSILLWFYCFVLKSVFSLETLISADEVRHSLSDDKLLIEGSFVSTSDIKTLVNNRTIKKVYIYVVNTFYVDDNLELRGVRELQIFAHLWNVSRAVTFDLSGLDGESQTATSDQGSAGNPGNAGMSGGNFLGFTTELHNINLLTVKLNGGRGGDGQDGTGSDDVHVTFNKTEDSGDSDQYSKTDLQKYYQYYFEDRGYDPDISPQGDYTSLYALLVHSKTAYFEVRLHPVKCCGTTGMGGAGGLGGRSGTYTFKKIGPYYVHSSPQFITEEGSIGNPGKDAKPCKSTALDIRVTTELNNVVFISIPLRHSFSSKFVVGDRINSSRCPTHYVKGSDAVPENSLDNEQQKIETILAMIEYKAYLLDQMKNKPLEEIHNERIKEIESNWNVNNEYTLNDFVVEANTLEERFLELRKYVDFQQLYENLWKRIPKQKKQTISMYDDPESMLLFILSNKKRLLDGLFIVDLEDAFKSQIANIEYCKSIGRNVNTTDDRLRQNFYRLQFNTNANYILIKYYEVIDAYKLTYFPFAAKFLEPYQLPMSLTSYKDLNELISTATGNLKSLNQTIPEIKLEALALEMRKTSTESNDSEKYFYKWSNSENLDAIRQLFKGEKIKLFADIKQSKKEFNAFQFNTIDLIFRSSNKNVNDRLNEILKDFEVFLNHTGKSTFRCNDKFYETTTQSILINFSFSQNDSEIPVSENPTSRKLRENRALLSPYTLWEIELDGRGGKSPQFHKLEPFIRRVDIELHCSGKYITENAQICEDDNLDKIYSRI